MSDRSTRTSLILLGLLNAVLITALGSTSFAEDTPPAPLACGTEGPAATAEAGTTITVTGISSYVNRMVAFFQMFGSAHPGCEDCPPEKPNGCFGTSPMTNVESSTVSNGDGTYTLTLVAGENASGKHKCSTCFDEEPL